MKLATKAIGYVNVGAAAFDIDSGVTWLLLKGLGERRIEQYSLLEPNAFGIDKRRLS